MKKILVLGCSGSIGKSSLSIIKDFPEKFEICALQANTDEAFLVKAANEFGCKRNCLTGKKSSESSLIKFFGTESLKNFIQNSDADIIINGIAGSAGLLSSVYTLECGKSLALANKETMVMAGEIIWDIAKKHNAKILPVDSEHSAIFSLLEKCGKDSVENLIITASGGPFRNYTQDELKNVTLEKALAHPTWNMGPKITIDSSTLANKGLEVIEAYKLFGFESSKIKVVVHPQSLVHSMVQTKDGQIYAQISKPDMKNPILSAISWPECLENKIEKIDLSKLVEMQFMPPDLEKFPMLKYAFMALEKKGSYSIVFNAANEVAVEKFRKGKIKYYQIPQLVEKTLFNYDWATKCTCIEQVLEIDKKARKISEEIF